MGSLFETARRLLSSLWDALINAFFITADFEDDDVSFQWIMHWLSEQPSWKGARNVQISTSNFDLLHGVEIDSGEDSSTHSRKVTYLPAVSESYTLWYKYRWMGVTRAVQSSQGGWSTRETLTLSVMARDHGILAKILQDAKNGYIKAREDKITIYVSDSMNGWRGLATRPKRPLNSIILDPGTAELVVEDVRDFLSSKEWYAERGIPFRRGYLLHGAPGSGKTSLIHSIAGELGLDVYIISLSRSGLDDTSLADLISDLPERCIALMEDIDAAFHPGLSRETPHASSMQTPNDLGPDMQRTRPQPSGRVSLSGLLNALDGIGAQEGRVLFATTNKYNSLDPALRRPGRMDLHIEFKLASRFQAEELFKRFYAPSPSASARGSESKHPTALGKRGNGHVDTTGDPLIDLSESQAPPAPFSSSSPSPSPSFPSSPSSPPYPSPTATEKHEENTSDRPASGPTYVGVVHSGRAPTLSRDQINALAAQFALAVPERQLSMASLQGFLMMHKTRPFEAAADVEAWVEKELMERREAEKGENEQ
ncbi:P-loop containing nucleoside triphosphate hydrolase protein [Boletus edulis BED1]|uniref:P-loop containing nucleoside triphosphate hydrolase protein n=1 Tax=Boletus edulis BED1 TaxID=1328754 RepID=A0AAD4C4L9_BOLED|nr:P-loop containing nucleoside triphosphate hydrolase protein [Boletus edulis BED1]